MESGDTGILGLTIVWTIGHGTRPVEELVSVLRDAGVRTLVDVRRGHKGGPLLAPVPSLTLFGAQPRRRSRVAGSGEGDLDGEPRADALFRFDVELSTDGCDPFPHPHKSELAIATGH